MCNNLVSFYRRFTDCLVGNFAEWLFSPIASGFERIFRFMTTNTAPETGAGTHPFFGQPTGGTWQAVWEATWLGSGSPWMLGLAFILTFVGLYIRSTLSILGVGQMSSRERNGRLGKSVIMLAFWYPSMVLWLYIVEFLTVVFAPSQGSFNDMLTSLFTVSASEVGTAVAGTALGFLAFVPLLIAALGIGLLLLLTAMQDLLVIFYAWLIPIAIAFWSWGMPYLSDKAKEYAMLFIPISFIPVPLALFTRIFNVAIAENFLIDLGMLRVFVAPAIYVLVALFIVWKLLSEGAPWATKAVTVGAGLALAGGLYYAGAGRFAVAAAARGDISRGVTRGVLGSKYGPESTIQGTAKQNGKTNNSGNAPPNP